MRSGNAAPGGHVGPDGRVQNSNDVRLDLALELRGIRERVAVHFFAHRIENLPRRLHTQISREKRGLQILQDRRIDLPLAQKDRVDGFGERRLGFADGRLQAFRKSWFGLAEERNHKAARIRVTAT